MVANAGYALIVVRPRDGPLPDGRSLWSTRSAASLRSTTSLRSQDERKRGGLKGLLGLFR
jgi:hypothetical protein